MVMLPSPAADFWLYRVNAVGKDVHEHLIQLAGITLNFRDISVILV